MAYYNSTYANRVTLDGDTSLERIQSIGREDFVKYLADSPNKQTISISENSLDVAILTDRQTELVDRKILLAAYGSNIDVGDYFTWNSATWLVIIEEKNSMNRYFRGFIKQCNDNLKWYDQYGNEYNYPIYFQDRNINFVFTANGTNELNIPDNKSVGTIVITKDNITSTTLERDMKLVIGGQTWIIGSIDNTSSSGLLYVRVMESLLNEEEDLNEIADYNDKPVWEIIIPQGSTLSLLPTDTLQLTPLVLKDKVEQTGIDFTYASSAITKFTVNSSGLISGVSAGSGTCTISMTNNPLIYAIINISIADPVVENIAYILNGDRTIRWNQKKDYEIIKTINGIEVTAPTYTLSFVGTSGLVSLITSSIKKDTFTIQGNNERLLGTINIQASTGGSTVIDIPIEVIGLWAK